MHFSYLWNVIIASHNQSSDKVVTTITASFKYWNLKRHGIWKGYFTNKYSLNEWNIQNKYWHNQILIHFSWYTMRITGLPRFSPVSITGLPKFPPVSIAGSPRFSPVSITGLPRFSPVSITGLPRFSPGSLWGQLVCRGSPTWRRERRLCMPLCLSHAGWQSCQNGHSFPATRHWYWTH